MTRVLMVVAAIGSMTGLALAAAVATAAPAGAVTCTGDTWTNTAGGSWDTAGNWSLNAPPTGTEAACITAAGSYTVTIGNETIADSGVAVTLGASGSTPTLAIGNSGSSEPAVTFASVTTTAGTSLTFDWGGTLTVTGTFTNAGTVSQSAHDAGTFDIATFDNQGTFTTGGGSAYTLPSSAATFLNDTTGILSVPSAASLTFSSPAGDTGTVTQDGVVNNSGTLVVQDELVVQGGSICGTAPQVGVDGGSIGTLHFASTVTAGPACGGATDNIDIANVTSNGTLSGNIPSAYTVVIGNGGSSCPAITVSGALSNAGTLDATDCTTLTATSSLTNTGTIDVPLTGFAGATFVFTNFTNNGLFEINTTSTYTLPTSTSTFTNGSSGTVDVVTGSVLTVSSPSAVTGTFTQDGAIDLPGINALTIDDAVVVDGGSICGAPLYIGADGGSIGTLTFAATVGSGTCTSGSLKDNIDFNNVASNGTLTGNIPAAYTVELGNGGSSEPNVTFVGAITNSGTLEPGWEGTYTDTSTLTNKGTLEVPSSSFASVYDFTDLVNKGKFVVDAPVTMSLPTSGSLDNTGTLTVASGQSLVVSSTASPQGSVTQDGTIDNSGTLSVEAPVSIAGGSICGNRLNIGVDGGAGQSLSFVGAVAAGPACGTGLASDQIFLANDTGTLNGTVAKGYTVLIGDGGSSFAHYTSSATSNAGVIEAQDGATMTFTGASFTNTGTLEFPANAYTSTEFIFSSNVTNSGKIVANAGGTFVLPAGDTLTNAKKIKIGGTTTTINITGSLDNTKVLQVGAGDAVDVSGTFTQSTAGTFKPGLASASSFGLLNVAGTASVAGTLTEKLQGGYHPSNGATWVVLKSGGLGGTTFTTVSGTGYSANYVASDSNVQLAFS